MAHYHACHVFLILMECMPISNNEEKRADFFLFKLHLYYWYRIWHTPVFNSAPVHWIEIAKGVTESPIYWIAFYPSGNFRVHCICATSLKTQWNELKIEKTESVIDRWSLFM